MRDRPCSCITNRPTSSNSLMFGIVSLHFIVNCFCKTISEKKIRFFNEREFLKYNIGYRLCISIIFAIPTQNVGMKILPRIVLLCQLKNQTLKKRCLSSAFSVK